MTDSPMYLQHLNHQLKNMQTSSPLVSVGILSFNRPFQLNRALTSLINQTHDNLEILISNVYPTDTTTEKVIQAFRQKDERIISIQTVHSEGKMENYHDLLRDAHGEYFMWLADNDYLDSSNVIQILVEKFISQPELIFVFPEINLLKDGFNYKIKEKILGKIFGSCHSNHEYLRMWNQNEKIYVRCGLINLLWLRQFPDFLKMSHRNKDYAILLLLHRFFLHGSVCFEPQVSYNYSYQPFSHGQTFFSRLVHLFSYFLYMTKLYNLYFSTAKSFRQKTLFVKTMSQRQQLGRLKDVLKTIFLPPKLKKETVENERLPLFTTSPYANMPLSELQLELRYGIRIYSCTDREKFYLGHITKVLDRLHDSIHVVYDIGANNGWWAQAFAMYTEDKGKVYAFEPIPELISLLEAYKKEHPHIMIQPVACGESNTSSSINVDKHKISASSILQMTDSHKREMPHTGDSYSVPIQVVRLDDWRQEHDAPIPDLIKLDVQGFEERVMLGGEQTFRQSKYLWIELCFEQFYENGSTFSSIYDLVTSYGFELIDCVQLIRSKSSDRLLYMDGIFRNLRCSST